MKTRFDDKTVDKKIRNKMIIEKECMKIHQNERSMINSRVNIK